MIFLIYRVFFFEINKINYYFHIALFTRTGMMAILIIALHKFKSKRIQLLKNSVKVLAYKI